MEYVRDLGLVAHDDPVRIANPIYGEVVPRELTYAMQSGLTQETPRYLDPEGGLNMAGLLEAFQEFFCQHFEEDFLVGGAADGCREGEKEARCRAGGQRICWAKPPGQT